MYTPHTVTVFTEYSDGDMGAERTMAVLRGVFLDSTKSYSVSSTGANSNDSVTLFVPCTVRATALDGSVLEYIPPKRFAELEDKSGYWTMQSAGDASTVGTFFAKGIVTENQPFSWYKKHYDDVYKIESVKTRDFGSTDMHHWQVSAT